MIYYDFSKLLQGVICPVLESSGGKRSIFIGWGVMCSTSYSLGGEVDFFLYLYIHFHSSQQTKKKDELEGLEKATTRAHQQLAFPPDAISSSRRRHRRRRDKNPWKAPASVRLLMEQAMLQMRRPRRLHHSMLRRISALPPPAPPQPLLRRG
jgi:hypothetical protein